MALLQSVEGLGYGRKIFSDGHDDFRATARRFFKREIEPYVKEWQHDVFFPADVFKKAGQAGLLCAGISEAYVGGGGDFLHHALPYKKHRVFPCGARMGDGLPPDTPAFVLSFART